MNHQQKIDNSIKLLREHEPPEGYHLAFSGGKDSICILKLAKMSGVKFTAYFYMTTLDPPEILQFIRKYYSDIIWLRPKKSFFKLIEENGLPTRQKRFCCKYLKECHGLCEQVVTGIRKDESTKRAKRSVIEQKFHAPLWSFINPIFDWDEKDVWDFIKENKLIFSELYTSCNTRIGCIFCPMKGSKGMRRDDEDYPKFKRAIIKAIRKRMDTGLMKSLNSAEEWFEWWISGMSLKSFKEKKNQT